MVDSILEGIHVRRPGKQKKKIIEIIALCKYVWTIWEGTLTL